MAIWPNNYCKKVMFCFLFYLNCTIWEQKETDSNAVGLIILNLVSLSDKILSTVDILAAVSLSDNARSSSLSKTIFASIAMPAPPINSMRARPQKPRSRLTLLCLFK